MTTNYHFKGERRYRKVLTQQNKKAEGILILKLAEKEKRKCSGNAANTGSTASDVH